MAARKGNVGIVRDLIKHAWSEFEPHQQGERIFILIVYIRVWKGWLHIATGPRTTCPLMIWFVFKVHIWVVAFPDISPSGISISQGFAHYDCTCNQLISSMMPVKPNVVIVTVAAGQVSGLLFSSMYLHLTCSETGILQPSSLSVLTIPVIQCATSWLQYNIQNCPITVAFIVITHCSINIIQYVGWGYSIWPSQGWGSHWCVSTK